MTHTHTYTYTKTRVFSLTNNIYLPTNRLILHTLNPTSERGGRGTRWIYDLLKFTITLFHFNFFYCLQRNNIYPTLNTELYTLKDLLESVSIRVYRQLNYPCACLFWSDTFIAFSGVVFVCYWTVQDYSVVLTSALFLQRQIKAWTELKASWILEIFKCELIYQIPNSQKDI